MKFLILVRPGVEDAEVLWIKGRLSEHHNYECAYASVDGTDHTGRFGQTFQSTVNLTDPEQLEGWNAIIVPGAELCPPVDCVVEQLSLLPVVAACVTGPLFLGQAGAFPPPGDPPVEVTSHWSIEVDLEPFNCTRIGGAVRKYPQDDPTFVTGRNFEEIPAFVDAVVSASRR